MTTQSIKIVINRISSLLGEDFGKSGFVCWENFADVLEGCRVHFFSVAVVSELIPIG
jgi:hypothetical protein